MDALIVEDDDLMADLLETVVAGLHPAMTVQKVSGVQQALECLRRKKGLLIVDWNLPDGSGLEVIRQVRAADYQKQAETVAADAQRVALAMGKRAVQFFTAGLLSRMGELAVLKVMDQYLKQGGTLAEDEVEQGIRDWAQPYGNRLKVQWRLPLELRQLIGAVHYLSRENVTQDRLIMRAGALLASSESQSPECGRLLRQLGLEEWQNPVNQQGSKDDGRTDD